MVVVVVVVVFAVVVELLLFSFVHFVPLGAALEDPDAAATSKERDFLKLIFGIHFALLSNNSPIPDC